ncbi:MAG: cbb3-type cytochrome c oxidase subunit I [Gammaproteobacteria bacterium]|nr:cbb3-type cytochrome c oxidase subunit I [Gammaproteobacteria bacterium]
MHESKERAPKLVKFAIMSAGMLFIGTFQGMVQVIGPVREWLVSIGTPNTNPGHLIDPLAHVHINLIGGVVLFMIGTIYYTLPRMSGLRIYSMKLVDHSFWWISIGVLGFYSSLLFFGITEGMLMLEGKDYSHVHAYYTPVIVTFATTMTTGYGCFFANIALTILKGKKVEES